MIIGVPGILLEHASARCTLEVHANPCAPVIEPLGTGTSGPVNSLTTALNTDGVRELYIGGDFSTVNGMTANHLAVWEGDDWRAFLQLQGVIGLPAPVGHLATAPNPALADDLVFALGTDDALGLLYFGSVPLEGLGFTIALINPGALSYWELSHLAYSTAGGEPSLLMSGFFFSQVPGEPATMLDRYRFDTSDWEHVVGPSGCFRRGRECHARKRHLPNRRIFASTQCGIGLQVVRVAESGHF